MSGNAVKLACTLWVSAVVLIATRYLCASLTWIGSSPDQVTFQMALDSIGPFLPALSTACLLGGLAVALCGAVSAFLRNKKK